MNSSANRVGRDIKKGNRAQDDLKWARDRDQSANKNYTRTTRLRRIARAIGIALLVIVGTIALFVLALPVLIAPFITGTPLRLSPV